MNQENKQQEFSNSGRIWTKQEEEKLAAIIISSVNGGKTYKSAFYEASKILGRTQYSVESHWHKNVKSKKHTQLVLDVSTDEKTNSEFSAAKEVDKTKEDEKDIIIKENTNEKVLKELQKSRNAVETKNENNDTNKKTYYEGRKKAVPINGVTKLDALRKSIETFESEDFKVLDSGKEGLEYIVINNEGDKGYLVKVDADKVVECNCPHHQYRGAICKHQLKVAFEKNLEVF